MSTEATASAEARGLAPALSAWPSATSGCLPGVPSNPLDHPLAKIKR
ncbi:MAG: hypothetical protein MUF44_07765 [Hydrogenophaga sp.]|nr:hypothetical protein [Hydrogenophaga sp.]